MLGREGWRATQAEIVRAWSGVRPVDVHRMEVEKKRFTRSAVAKPALGGIEELLRGIFDFEIVAVELETLIEAEPGGEPWIGGEGRGLVAVVAQ